MATILYFAYGSNMLTEWLRARCPSARVRGVASAAGYRLAFSKRSKDGSGKAMLVADAASHAHGVLFNIAEEEMEALDRSEGRGKGYERLEGFTVRSEPDGAPLRVTTYMADETAVDAALKPYDWYLDLAVKGAEQHGLPADYVDALRMTPFVPDPDPDRPTKIRALPILAKLKRSA
jgi:gamma-glutamylcyclotransferase (GGCT)/AIG2-like uncharacterized protein YtfP